MIYALYEGREVRLDDSEDLFSSEIQDFVSDRGRAAPATWEVLGLGDGGNYPSSRENYWT